MAKATAFFVEGLVGKDRRVRPIAGRTTVNGLIPVGNAGVSNLDFAQCSPNLGAKVGIAKRFQNNWELAVAGGVALSLVNADGKVREHEVLADVEAKGSEALFASEEDPWEAVNVRLEAIGLTDCASEPGE